jgi:penicillin-binding protein 2
VLRTKPVDVGRVKRPGKGPARKKETEPSITKARMQVRVVALAMLVAAAFLCLGFRLWYLQVLTGENYTDTAQAIQTREVTIPAQRGVVYDREGRVLANNVPGLNVTVVPNAIERAKVEELAEILHANKEEVLASYDAAFETGNQYGPMIVKENADREDVMYVSERTEEFDGLVVNDDFVRNYPEGELASHVLGYTGAITPEELAAGGMFEGLENDSVVGKGGVEFSYEEVLRGKRGVKEYNVDALGREVEVRMADGSRYDGRDEDIPEEGEPARITDPVPGKDLRLTVDLELQEVAEKELDGAIARAQENGYEGSGGAVIAMDPRNGEILAMASRPNFDPQLFVGGVTGAEEIEQFQFLNSEYANAPFANRAIYGNYPSASTHKVFTGMAGLEQGAITPATTVTDTGECWRPAGSIGGCWQSWRENSPKYEFLGPHGTQNYAEALMDSNDKFFYQVADWIWNRTDDENWLPKFYERFGFGALTGIDLPAETPGRVPTREWQEEAGATPDDKLWTVGRWVNMAIGQGDLLATPMQVIRGYAAIQNDGTLVTPHVGLDVRDQNGDLVEEISPDSAGKVNVSQQSLQTTIEGLRKVTGPGGTAENIFEGSKLQVVGKSGTGEVWGSDWVNWFVGWAENQERPMIVLVMVEGGGAFEQGSEVTAGPAARHVLESFYGVEPAPENAAQPAAEDEPAEAPADGALPTVPQPAVPAVPVGATYSGTPGYYAPPTYSDPNYQAPAY